LAKTAIIILNWNGVKYLQQFFSDIVRYSEDDETQVIVADNGSTDASLTYLRQNFPNTPLICFDKNHGFTGGYNRAIAQIDAPYTVLLNSDIEVQKDWLKPLIAHLDAHPQTAVCMPKMLEQASHTKFEYAGAAGGFIDILGYPFCRGRILDHIEPDGGQYNSVRNVFWATGACMAIRTPVYKALGGLDDDFFAHMEEIDLCWRVQTAGFKVQCITTSAVYHVGGGTLPNRHPQKLFLNYRNNLLMLYKNLPTSMLLPVLAIRLLADCASAVIYLCKKEINFAGAVFAAYRSFWRLKKGKRKQTRHAFKTLDGVYPSSILLAYFVKRKKNFSQLLSVNRKQ
jgi:GT2 family glycosyltransferase